MTTKDNSSHNVTTVITTPELDDVLTRRQRAVHEINRLKSIVSGCDVEIETALDASVDQFSEWVREVRGEVQDIEKRRIKWSDGQDWYTVYKRKGNAPRRTISAEKLAITMINAGIPADKIHDWIEAATTLSAAGKPGITVRKVGGKDDDED